MNFGWLNLLDAPTRGIEVSKHEHSMPIRWAIIKISQNGQSLWFNDFKYALQNRDTSPQNHDTLVIFPIDF